MANKQDDSEIRAHTFKFTDRQLPIGSTFTVCAYTIGFSYACEEAERHINTKVAIFWLPVRHDKSLEPDGD